MAHQSEQLNLIQPHDFRDLYIKQKQDLEVTTFQDISGFSIVRNYPENTEFYDDKNLMFIRIYLKGEAVCGGVEMVSSRGHNEGMYYLVDLNKYKKKVTGFSFCEEEGIIFDSKNKKIQSKKSKTSVSINEFIDFLVKNHMQDKLFLKRKINLITRSLLIFIFWLSNYKYDDIKIFVNTDNPQIQNQRMVEKDAEPFFKYFHISKNILFTLSVVVILILAASQYYNFIESDLFTASNPIFIFAFFIFLFISEKITSFLDGKIKEFVGKNKKENFISNLHFYQYRNSFKLKF